MKTKRNNWKMVVALSLMIVLATAGLGRPETDRELIIPPGNLDTNDQNTPTLWDVAENFLNEEVNEPADANMVQVGGDYELTVEKIQAREPNKPADANVRVITTTPVEEPTEPIEITDANLPCPAADVNEPNQVVQEEAGQEGIFGPGCWQALALVVILGLFSIGVIQNIGISNNAQAIRDNLMDVRKALAELNSKLDGTNIAENFAAGLRAFADKLSPQQHKDDIED